MTLERNTFMSDRGPDPAGPYPHAKQVGEFLFVSGMGPRKRGQKEIPGVTLDENGAVESYDFETQCHAVFENIKNILEDAGSSWDNIVDVTAFLTDLRADFQTFNKVYAEYFGHVQPTRTTVEVSRLPTPIAVELKVIATIE